ncbi:MAG: biotin transporter BioY, partial [Erysipelotrichaceae bacterium]
MKTKEMTYCAVFAAVLAVLAQIQIPMPNGIPFTLQVLGVVLCGLILKARLAMIATSIYLLVGMIGLPVFSHFGSGLSVLLGPTGGFLWSFPLFAWIVGTFAHEKRAKVGIAILLGAGVNYACGMAQFMLVMQARVTTAFLT